jgi:glutathione S-transferase
MSKLELISFKLCPFVQRAVIVLNEKGVNYDITYIDLKNQPEWFKEISPLGQVPVLKVDDEVLFESTVIQEYLDEITPPSLHPEDSLLKAKNRAWISFAGDLNMDVFKMIQSQNEEAFQQAYQAILNKLVRVEAEHSGKDFFNGGQFALIDSSYAPMLMRLNLVNKHCGIDFLSQTPKLAAWSEKLLSMSCIQKSVVDNFEQIFTGMLGSVDGYLATKLTS